MTPGIYQANLKAKIEVETGFCFRGNRPPQVQPAGYENLLLPKRVMKKEARGAGQVGRKKTSATGLRILGRREIRGKSANLSNGGGDLRHDVGQGAELGYCLENFAQVSQKSRKTPKQVRFDEESEWIDISDDDIPDTMVDPERWPCERDKDEFILI
jgi:hypothetical protein